MSKRIGLFDMKHIHSPNLPSSRVTVAAVGHQYERVIAALEGVGISCIKLDACDRLPPAVQYHADMLLHHLGGRELLIHNEHTKDAQELMKYGFSVAAISQPLGATYPFDCTLNVLRLGNRIICGRNPAPEITRYCENKGIEQLMCAQGYARCSVCVVSDNAIITTDPSIAAICKQEGIDVLKISAGHIRLDGYPYGFIGGCCGLIDKGVLAFTGVLERHPDSEIMLDFLQKYNVKHINLTDGELLDIGGILPLACE